MSSKYNLYELNLLVNNILSNIILNKLYYILVNNILSNINKSLFYDYET